jgi:aspartate/methionine/tyrosine aminotransferase
MLAVAGQGDKVVIPAPYWPSYPDMAKLCGAKPVILTTRAKDGYLLQPQTLQQALQQHPETKLLVLCHPSNPTGSVYSKTQLEELVTVLNKFPQVFVLADEIYERLVYDGTEHVSMASLLPERTILINGFSKAYAMTGLRLGYAAAPSPIAKAIATIQSQLTSCASSVAQAAGVAALTQVDEQQLQVLYDELQIKRDYVLSELAQIPGVHVAVPPKGAFYVMPSIEAYCNKNNKDDVVLCKELLERHQLALVPGSSFGAPNTVRISYATSLSELKIAMRKLATFFEEERADQFVKN